MILLVAVVPAGELGELDVVVLTDEVVDGLLRWVVDGLLDEVVGAVRVEAASC
jgi:hypothetical protein